MSEWKETILDEFVDSISETFKFNSEPVVFLNTSDILAGKVLHHDTSDPKTLPGQAKKRIRKGDFLFSEIRPINKRYARITFDAENYVVSTKLMVLRSKGEIEPIYLEYFLTSDETLEYLQMIAEDRSGTFPQITFDIIKRLEISLPPLPEQRAIASVLSSLDDKIDLLHRQNQTLEQMAETLFRQWFVEEEKDNWEVVLFEDFVKHVKPGTNYQPKRVDFGIPFLNVRCLDNGFVNTSNSTYITQSEYERVHSKWVPEANDVLISRIGTLGLVAVITEEDLPIAVHYNMINLKAKMSSYQFLYFLLKSKWFQEEYLTKARQSVQAYLAIDDVKSIELKLPIGTDEFIAKQEIFNSLFDKIKSNQTQIRTLTALRDTLLPKLMSGEVRVEMDATAKMEEA